MMLLTKDNKQKKEKHNATKQISDASELENSLQTTKPIIELNKDNVVANKSNKLKNTSNANKIETTEREF
jgi:lipopolysaccharide export system protein LptC